MTPLQYRFLRESMRPDVTALFREIADRSPADR